MAISKVQDGGLLTTGDIATVVIYTWLENQYGLISMHLKMGSYASVPSCGDVAWSIQNDFSASLQPLVSTPTQLLGTRVMRLGTNVLDKAGVATDTAVGSGGAQPLPTQTTGLVGYYTTIRGPSGRGRSYMPFPATSAGNATTGLPTPAYVTAVQNWGRAFLGPYTGSGPGGANPFTATFGLYARKLAIFTAYASAIGRPVWGTQKRRGDLGRFNPPTIPL